MRIDIEKFLFLYQGAVGTLNDHQRRGLRDVLQFISDDPHVSDPRWAAYMLATTRHECAGKWLPIEEFGKGKGRSYGIPDASGQIFYGRGYVQLTHAANYKSVGKALGIDLYGNPSLALDAQIAYQIMSYGMRRGAFTGVGLSKYINADKCDYLHARKIINGMDCAEKIAAYASEFEAILSECCGDDSSSVNQEG